MAGKYDVVVVGAGWHGLAAAKVYIELHPFDRLVVLEAENTCGGTWSENRLYPNLKSNNLLDTYEFPDLPMSPDVYGVQAGEHIPGHVLHRYLTDFAKRFGVLERTKLNTKAEGLQPSTDGGWIITASSAREGRQTIETSKVIIATGLTSQPNFPQYPGTDEFGAPCFHAKDFCRHGETVKTCKEVVVVGSGKSALDVAYAYAVEGAKVHMVIRQTGNGPVWI